MGATFHSFCCVRDDEEGVGRKCFRFVREGSAPKNWVTPGCATALQFSSPPSSVVFACQNFTCKHNDDFQTSFTARTSSLMRDRAVRRPNFGLFQKRRFKYSIVVSKRTIVALRCCSFNCWQTGVHCWIVSPLLQMIIRNN